MRTFQQIILFILLTSFCSTNKLSDKPKLTKLKISECIEDCKDPNKILSESYVDSLYRINFGMLLNCCGQDTLSVKIKGDTLKLKILAKRKSQFKVTVKGDTIWAKPECECECYFKFEAEIKYLPTLPKVISVNKQILAKK